MPMICKLDKLKRDRAADLLESVRQMKAGKTEVVTSRII